MEIDTFHLVHIQILLWCKNWNGLIEEDAYKDSYTPFNPLNCRNGIKYQK